MDVGSPTRRVSRDLAHFADQPVERRSNVAFWKQFNAARPRILGASAVLLYGVIRHGDCPRGREPAHLMQPSAYRRSSGSVCKYVRMLLAIE